MTAIVVGGTSGLGLEIARLLASRGQRVVTVSRRDSSEFPHISGDASRRETALRAIELAGDADLLVNCAGIGIYGPIGSYGDASIARMIESNLTATIIFCEALGPRLMRDGGTIINILSSAALVGKPNETVYCAAKWGARGYTEALRAEAKGTKLRVMSVAPGGMNTPFWPEARESFMDAKEIAAVIVDAIERRVNVSELVITRA